MSDADTRWNRIRTVLLWLALPLLIGTLAASLIPKPVIGVIRLEDAIYSYSAKYTILQIQYAIEHPEVRAVTIVVDSPGGTVVDTESVYMELTRLREKKPVVTVVNGMCASGCYYLSANTDYIFAKPTSLVGNIGVIGYLPAAPFVIEDIITTGPYKLWGSPRDSDMRQIDMVKQGFFEVVRLGRGDKITSPDNVTFSGQIWSGIDGLKMGIIDEFGTENDGAKKAAELAKVAHYETLDLAALASAEWYDSYFFMQSADGLTLPYPKEAGMYMLYIPTLPVEQ